MRRRLAARQNQWLLPQQFHNALQRRPPALYQVHHPPHRDHGPHQHPHVRIEHDEAAQPDAVLQQSVPAHPQHDQERHPDQGLQQRHEQSGQPGQPDVLRDVFLVERFKLPDLVLLLRVRPDHAHPGKVLLHAAADFGEHLLDNFEAVVNAAAEPDHDEAHQGSGDQRQQRQFPIHR